MSYAPRRTHLRGDIGGAIGDVKRGAGPRLAAFINILLALGRSQYVRIRKHSMIFRLIWIWRLGLTWPRRSRKRSRSKRWIRSQRTADSQSSPSAWSSRTSWDAMDLPRRLTHKRPFTCFRAATRSSIERITTGWGNSSVKGNRKMSHCLILRRRVLNPGKYAPQIPPQRHPGNMP
jgi:hypothetical protein